MHSALEGHEHHFSVLPDGRCKCLLNGHVFPTEPQAVATFIRGRKYGHLCAMEEDGKVLQLYEPYLTPSKNFEDKLFCRLTCQLLKKSTKAAKAYMEGKRFHRAKELHDKGDQELMSEPDLDSDESEELASEQTRQRGESAQAALSRPAMDGHQSDDSLENMLEAGQGSPHNVDLHGKAGTRELSVPRKGRPPRPKRRKHATGNM